MIKDPPTGEPSNEGSFSQRRGNDKSYSKGASPALLKDSTGDVPSPQQLVELAEKIQSARARRKELIGGDSIGEAGWEVLLALFRADAAFHRLTVSNLCDASHAPPTTALRWIERLVELDYIYRHKSPVDARVVFVELKPRARAAMQTYFCEIWASLYGRNKSVA